MYLENPQRSATANPKSPPTTISGACVGLGKPGIPPVDGTSSVISVIDGRAGPGKSSFAPVAHASWPATESVVQMWSCGQHLHEKSASRCKESKGYIICTYQPFKFSQPNHSSGHPVYGGGAIVGVPGINDDPDGPSATVTS